MWLHTEVQLAFVAFEDSQNMKWEKKKQPTFVKKQVGVKQGAAPYWSGGWFLGMGPLAECHI